MITYYLSKTLRKIFQLKNKGVLFPRILGNYLFAYLKIVKNVPFPVEMQIEPSAACNLSCVICSLRISKKSKDPFLKKDNFVKLLGDLKTLKTINLIGIGESLLNPNMADLVKVAKERKIETIIITNAQLLTPKRINDLIKSGLYRMCISMESGIPSSYEKFRPGAKFEILKRNVWLLNKAILKLNNNLQVVINIVLLRECLESSEHLETIVDFANINNIKLVTLQFPHDIFQFNLTSYFEKDKGKLKRIFNSLKNYANSKGVTIIFPSSLDIKKGSCYYPWIYPQITASGELIPCCLIPQFGDYIAITKEFSFGNVFEKSFGEVWNSPKATEFRNTVKMHPNRYCRKCSKYLGIL